VIPNDALNEEGDLIHMALLADSEPINFKDASKVNVWKKAMEEELRRIAVNKEKSDMESS
jgi:hypothetical protein